MLQEKIVASRGATAADIRHFNRLRRPAPLETEWARRVRGPGLERAVFDAGRVPRPGEGLNVKGVNYIVLSSAEIKYGKQYN